MAHFIKYVNKSIFILCHFYFEKWYKKWYMIILIKKSHSIAAGFGKMFVIYLHYCSMILTLSY